MSHQPFPHLRGVRADAAVGDVWYLLKHVTLLRLTDQIRLLTFRAVHDGGRLIIRVPADCQLSEPLAAFVEEHQAHVAVERV